MNNVELYDTTHANLLSNCALTEEQESVAPLIAVGVPIKQIVKMTLIPMSRINAWIKGDSSFITAVNILRAEKERVIQEKMDQAGLLAADYAINVLTEKVDISDPVGRNIQAGIAKTFLTQKQSNRSIIVHGDVNASLPANIDDRSKQIISRFSGEPVENYVVINDVKITGDDVLMHQDSQMGSVNYDEDTQKFQCYICGRWNHDLVVHLRQMHDMSSIRYREMYKIPA